MDPTRVSDEHRPLPTPFLRKTYQLVDDPAVNDTISWNEDGSTFVVWRPAEFARDLLPKYFKHNNFSSFVRQLNTYGFRKIAPDRWEFANGGFRRGERRLLLEIHRRKVPAATAATNLKVVDGAAAVPVSFTANAIPETYTVADQSRRYLDGSSRNRDLLDENERLKKENTNLNNELTQVKCMCKNIMSVMSTYSTETSKVVEVEKAPLDVVPTLQQPVLKVPSSGSGCGEETMEGEDNVPRSAAMLFGVPIGKKVVRRDISENRVEVMALDKHNLSAAAAAGESGADEGNEQIRYFYEEYDKCWVYS